MLQTWFKYALPILGLLTLTGCYYLEGHRVSRADKKYCSELKGRLTYLDSPNKRIHLVRVRCVLCKSPMENPITGELEYIMLEGPCSCKEYFELYELQSNDSTKKKK